MKPASPSIPLVDVAASFRSIRKELMREIEKILEGGDLLLGPNVRAFENEFASYCGVEHGIGLSSGTEALFAALMACGVGPGDEVIVPAHTFFATVEAVVHTGATPVLVDCEPETLSIDPKQISPAITPSTRAIVPVHLYGHAADMDPILEIARQRGLRVIEDAAQAHGARYKGRRCGSMGDAGCFSFYMTKNLGAFGEAGFVTTRSPSLAEKVRLLRHHGHVSKFEHAVVGYNLRMDELQAAVLRIKLRRLDEDNRRRRELAARYRALLAESPVRQPPVRADCEPVHHVYPIRVEQRDALAEFLSAAGIQTGIHYRIPAHLQPALRGRSHRCGSLEVTEAACGQLLSLPIYSELPEDRLDFIATRVRHFFERAEGTRST